MDRFCQLYFMLVCVVSVPCSLMATCWERADLLAVVFVVFCYFPKCVFNNFSAQLIKIISHYKKIGYNINVLQQTACLWSTKSHQL